MRPDTTRLRKQTDSIIRRAVNPPCSLSRSFAQWLWAIRTAKLSAVRDRRLARCRMSFRWAAQGAEQLRLLAMTAVKVSPQVEHSRRTPGFMSAIADILRLPQTFLSF